MDHRVGSLERVGQCVDVAHVRLAERRARPPQFGGVHGVAGDPHDPPDPLVGLEQRHQRTAEGAGGAGDGDGQSVRAAHVGSGRRSWITVRTLGSRPVAPLPR